MSKLSEIREDMKELQEISEKIFEWIEYLQSIVPEDKKEESKQKHKEIFG